MRFSTVVTLSAAALASSALAYPTAGSDSDLAARYSEDELLYLRSLFYTEDGDLVERTIETNKLPTTEMPITNVPTTTSNLPAGSPPTSIAPINPPITNVATGNPANLEQAHHRHGVHRAPTQRHHSHGVESSFAAQDPNSTGREYGLGESGTGFGKAHRHGTSGRFGDQAVQEEFGSSIDGVPHRHRHTEGSSYTSSGPNGYTGGGSNVASSSSTRYGDNARSSTGRHFNMLKRRQAIEKLLDSLAARGFFDED